jgi:hypothetical protein
MTRLLGPCPLVPWLVTAVLSLAPVACRRTQGTPTLPDLPAAAIDPRDVRCVERPEGCVLCEGRGAPPPLLEPDEPPSSLCDPKDSGNCVDFCSRLAPECATPWARGPSCLLSSEEEFRREVFRQDTADRPEFVLQGRVLDEAGRRLDGASVRVSYQGTTIDDQVAGKDGSFRVRLRTTANPYTLRISHPGRATEISEVKIDSRAVAAPRVFHLGVESALRGRVVDGTGAPVPRVEVRALRSAEDQVEVASARSGDDGQFVLVGLEGRKYVLIASTFGWLPSSTRATAAPPAAPAPRVVIRLVRTGVIRGAVVDDDGDGTPNAIVVAMLSGGFGVAISPIVWTTDAEGKFEQDRFVPGTYYLWARHGDQLVYPPEKIELAEGHLDVDVKLKVSHKGARVRGRVETTSGQPVDPEARAVLVGRSPLAFPRKAVGDIDRAGHFTISGVLPGRYEFSVRLGPRVLPMISGLREVEVPIEDGAAVDLSEPVVVRPRPEE